MLNKGGNLIAGKQFTDLTKASALKDTNIIAVHDGNGLKKASMEDVTMYMADKFSNPNLLINPNFKINQRGQATYETSGASQIYSADRWRLGRGKVTVNSDGTVTVTATGGTTNEEGYYQQYLENAISGDYTVSMEVISVSGAVRIAIDGAWKNIKSGLNVFHGITGTGAVGLQLANGASITLKWVKLEQGSIATPFVAPNIAEELIKCKGFYKSIEFTEVFYSGTKSTEYIFSYVIQNMRIKPTATSNIKDHYGLSAWKTTVNDNNNGLTVKAVVTSSMVGDCNIGGIVKLDAEIY